MKKIIMIVMCTDASLDEGEKVLYTYSAESILDVDSEQGGTFNFTLYQNYPNPFNSSTIFSFVIDHSSFVTLKVYDVLGNEVSSLVNKELHSSEYEVSLDAPGLTVEYIFTS